jgi:hypothetical protein
MSAAPVAEKLFKLVASSNRCTNARQTWHDPSPWRQLASGRRGLTKGSLSLELADTLSGSVEPTPKRMIAVR